MRLKLLISTSLLLTLILLNSCNKILHVSPKDFISDQDFYQNEDEFKSAISGIYSILQPLYTTASLYVFTETRSDNTTYQYNPQNRCCVTREQIDEFTNIAADRYTESLWSTLYQGINQCNILLNNIDNVNFKDQGLKTRFSGEAKFLRGLFYFHLVRLFGKVPLRLDKVATPEEALTKERSGIDDVYLQIENDVKDAINSLPEEYSGNDKGRATKGAALTLLGEVYLTLKRFDDAVTQLEAVTKITGYGLMSEYDQIFDPNYKNNIESVFEIQYNEGLEGQNSEFIFDFGPVTGRMDLTGWGGDLWGLNIPTPSVINAYENGDLRKDASIAYYTNPKNNNTFETYPGGVIPYIKKFYHPPYPHNGWSNENWPVYRYAQVLLMYSEALNEVNRSADAYEPLNRVRQRAGLASVAGLSQEKLRDTIYHEERVELAFENHRWYDLLRTGLAIPVMTIHGLEERQRLPRLTADSYVITPDKLLFPIPQSEIRINGFEQNPGY